MNESENKQNCSSTLGPQHLDPMDILSNVFTSRTSSRFLLIAVLIFLNFLIYCQKIKHYLKMGWCNIYPHL